jgi:hypothetical protein
VADEKLPVAARRHTLSLKEVLKALDYLRQSAAGQPLPTLPADAHVAAGAVESTRDARAKTHAKGRGPLE